VNIENKWYEEYFINQRILYRNKIICDKYPNVSIECLANKYRITPLYVLFILKREKVNLLPEHEEIIEAYVTDEYPFPNNGHGYVYKIYNTLDDMIYIGQTHLSLLHRFKLHIKEYKESTYIRRKLHQHFNLLGVEKFHIKLIEEVLLNDLNSKEAYWIEYYKSYDYGLNMTKGWDYLNRQELFKEEDTNDKK